MKLMASDLGSYWHLGVDKIFMKICWGENLFRPFEGNHEADVAPGENEFDTPALNDVLGTRQKSYVGRKDLLEDLRVEQSSILIRGKQTLKCS